VVERLRGCWRRRERCITKPSPNPNSQPRSSLNPVSDCFTKFESIRRIAQHAAAKNQSKDYRENFATRLLPPSNRTVQVFELLRARVTVPEVFEKLRAALVAHRSPESPMISIMFV
jgi:hypothetical protein